MWTKTFVFAAALMIAGPIFVYAQQGPGEPGASEENKGAASTERNSEDRAAFADARIAALHAGLKLNADQGKNWPAFEQALRELTQLRADRFARDQQPSSDPVMRLQRLADSLTMRGSALKRLADTLAPLYQSLDDGQKRRFTILARFTTIGFAVPHFEMPWMRSHHGMMGGRNNYSKDRTPFDDGEDMPD